MTEREVEDDEGDAHGIGVGQTRLQHIYEELRNRICLLEYAPGTILRESDLARSFGVSRTPIRNVLQRLQFEGLVQSKKRVGTIVTGFDLATFRNAFDVRLKVTEWVGEMATRGFSETDRADMENLLRRSNGLKNVFDPREYWFIANAIHEILGRIIDNNTLKSLYDLLFYQTGRTWFHVIPAMWDENVEMMCSEISEELRSMRAGDTRGVLLVRRNYIATFLANSESRVPDKELSIDNTKLPDDGYFNLSLRIT